MLTIFSRQSPRHIVNSSENFLCAIPGLIPALWCLVILRLQQVVLYNMLNHANLDLEIFFM